MITTKKPRVLVVDDQPEVGRTLQLALELDGYEVDFAEGGREGLDLFQPRKYSFVFTDFNMPQMNGHEFASLVKARDPHQPIIMVTAYADSFVNGESIPQVDLVIGKPWSLDELRRAMNEIAPPS